jgi:tRNA threonylcarbamoyladenosine biosynthesis protein TsaB
VILAIETATSACSAAVMAADGALAAQRVDDKGQAQTQRLLPFVHAVLEEAGVSIGDLEAVVCGLGPGAYTGMRIGVATARALAQAAGLRLGGAPTLAAVALALAPQVAPGAPLVALLDGKRREVFADVFRMDASVGADGSAGSADASPRALHEVAPLAVVAADDLSGYLDRWPGALLGGDGAVLYADRLPTSVTVAPDVSRPTAAMVGRAWLAQVPGAVEGFEAVLPIYGRAPDAARWQGAAAPSDSSRGTR